MFNIYICYSYEAAMRGYYPQELRNVTSSFTSNSYENISMMQKEGKHSLLHNHIRIRLQCNIDDIKHLLNDLPISTNIAKGYYLKLLKLQLLINYNELRAESNWLFHLIINCCRWNIV